jgi:hypothetical protein
MNKIYGIGLPRTGGTSLAAALRKFDVHGSNTCIVTNVMTTTSQVSGATRDLEFKINNEFPNHILADIESWMKSHNVDSTDLFIMTTRDTKEWKKSLYKYNYTEGSAGIPYKDEYETFVRNNIDPARLLVIDWNDCNDNCWERISDFIGKPLVTDEEFPCENC